MPSPLAVIFDADGVLVDSYQPHFVTWRDVLAQHGVDYTEPDFQRDFGRTSLEILRERMPEFDEATAVAIDLKKEAAYRDVLRADFPAMPGVQTLIDALDADGWRLAVGSSGPPENVTAALEGLTPNLNNPAAFRTTVSRADVTRGKPDPEVFLTAASRLGVSPERCVVIEDAVPGVRAAKAAGMACVAILGTSPADALRKAGADLVIQSHHELSPLALETLIASVAATP